jgi:hypothetical protein
MTIFKGGRFTSLITTGVTRKQASALIQLPQGIGMVQGVCLFLHQKIGNFIHLISGLNYKILQYS